jgi:hypothetical protein
MSRMGGLLCVAAGLFASLAALPDQEQPLVG